MNHKKHTIAVFPGTFDPITNGHLDLIKRGQSIFSELVVAIGHNPNKEEIFSLEERKALVNEILREESFSVNIHAEAFHGLTSDFAKSIGATIMLRGIRNVSDIQFEFQLALANRAVANIETVFIMCSEEFGFTSSSLIKQIVAGGQIDRLAHLLPQSAIIAIKNKMQANPSLLKDLKDSIAGQ